MQRFGLLALLIAGIGVVLVVVFLGGSTAGHRLVGTWEIEGAKALVTFKANGGFQMDRVVSGLIVSLQGTWTARELEDDQLKVTIRVQKISQREPGGEPQERAQKGLLEWTITPTGPDILKGTQVDPDGQTKEFRLQRTKE
jgi:hypothetical protein